MRASRKDYLEVVQALVEVGANTTAVSGDGQTAYNLAIEHGNQDIVDYLATA